MHDGTEQTAEERILDFTDYGGLAQAHDIDALNGDILVSLSTASGGFSTDQWRVRANNGSLDPRIEEYPDLLGFRHSAFATGVYNTQRLSRNPHTRLQHR